METNEIIKRCQQFLEDSNYYYGEEIKNQEGTLASVEDIFSEDVVKDYKRRKRKNLQYSKIPIIVGAISSPYTNSPYHTNIDDDQFKDYQELVDDFENALDTKLVSRKAFKRGVTCGAGYAVIGIDAEDKPTFEFIVNQSSVAVDANAVKPSLEDAEEGATIQFISKGKAMRMFEGIDTSANSGIDWTSLSRWANVDNAIQMVCYYYKDENGSVHQATICGNIVKDIDLRIHTIPIVRYAGFEKYKRGKHIQHIGVGDRMKDLQLSEAIAFSGMVERSNRTMKSKVAMSDKALQGDVVMNGIARCEDDESMVLPYHHEGGAPIQLNERFETGDLESIIERSRVLEQDCSGVLLQGLQPTEKTATESKYQQINQISNNDELYLNAEYAQRHISKIILEIVCGAIPKFTLQGGVGVIESTLLNERLMADVQALLVANQPMLAYNACKNSKASCAKELMKGIKANYPDVIFPSDDLDIYNEFAKAKQIAQQAIAEANNINTAKVEAEQTNKELNLQLMNSKAQLNEKANEFAVNTQLRIAELNAKLGLDTAKLEQKAQNDAEKMAVEASKAETEQAKVANEIAKDAVVDNAVDNVVVSEVI